MFAGESDPFTLSDPPAGGSYRRVIEMSASHAIFRYIYLRVDTQDCADRYMSDHMSHPFQGNTGCTYGDCYGKKTRFA